MDITREESVDEILILLKGRFDEVAVAQWRRWFEELASTAAKNVCLDLAEVTVIDAAAVGTIAFLFKRLAVRRKQLCLACPQGQPLELLKFLRLDRVITIRSAAALAEELGAARQQRIPANGTLRVQRAAFPAFSSWKAEVELNELQVEHEKLDGASGSRSGT
jgi:anti-anti-sigma factor